MKNKTELSSVKILNLYKCKSMKNDIKKRGKPGSTKKPRVLKHGEKNFETFY